MIDNLALKNQGVSKRDTLLNDPAAIKSFDCRPRQAQRSNMKFCKYLIAQG